MNDAPGQANEWFRTVVARYETPLVRYTVRITGDLERARDVVQDALLRLHQENGSRPANVQAWLYTVCRRRALDVLRKEMRMKTLDEIRTANCASPAQPQQDSLAQQETASQVLRLLCALPANQQEVVRLKFQDGLSYREIAEVTGHSVSNVGYLIHVAIKDLRERLATSG